MMRMVVPPVSRQAKTVFAVLSRGSRRTAEAFIRDFLATRSGEFLFAPVLREGVDAYIHRSTGGLAPGYDCAARSGCGLP